MKKILFLLSLTIISFPAVGVNSSLLGNLPSHDKNRAELDAHREQERAKWQERASILSPGLEVLVISDRLLHSELARRDRFPKDVSHSVVQGIIRSVNGERVTIMPENQLSWVTVNIRDVLLPQDEIHWHDDVKYKLNDRIAVGVKVNEIHNYGVTVDVATGTILKIYRPFDSTPYDQDYVALLQMRDLNEYPKERAYFKIPRSETRLIVPPVSSVLKKVGNFFLPAVLREPQSCDEILTASKKPRTLFIKTRPHPFRSII